MIWPVRLLTGSIQKRKPKTRQFVRGVLLHTMIGLSLQSPRRYDIFWSWRRRGCASRYCASCSVPAHAPTARRAACSAPLCVRLCESARAVPPHCHEECPASADSDNRERLTRAIAICREQASLGQPSRGSLRQARPAPEPSSGTTRQQP